MIKKIVIDTCDIDSAKKYPLRTRTSGEQVCIGENTETIYNNDILTKSLQPGEIKKTYAPEVSATTSGPSIEETTTATQPYSDEINKDEGIYSKIDLFHLQSNINLLLTKQNDAFKEETNSTKMFTPLTSLIQRFDALDTFARGGIADLNMQMLIKEEEIAKMKEQTIKSDAILKSKKIINQNAVTPHRGKTENSSKPSELFIKRR